MKGKRLENIDQCCLAGNVFGLIVGMCGKTNLNKLPGYTKVCCNNIMREINHLVTVCNDFDDDYNRKFIEYMNAQYKEIFSKPYTLGNIEQYDLDKLLPKIDNEVIHFDYNNDSELPF